jgi:hypothetical protein
MDDQNVEGFLRSRTVQMMLAVLATYIVKTWGVPLAPAEFQVALTEVLTVAMPIMIAGALYFRAKARTIISGWW